MRGEGEKSVENLSDSPFMNDLSIDTPSAKLILLEGPFKAFFMTVKSGRVALYSRGRVFLERSGPKTYLTFVRRYRVQTAQAIHR